MTDAWTGQVPPLTAELPLLAPLYPSQWEREWVVSWQPAFCSESILYAVALCAGYLAFCFGGKWVMSGLKPFDLRV